MPETEDPYSGDLKVSYSGGLADSNALLLEDYASSLEGWREIFQSTGELYLRSFPELRRSPGRDLLRIEIVAERPGSYNALLLIALGAAIQGTIGNRADAFAVWSFKRLTKWWRDLVSTHVRAKSKTTNIDEIVAALEQMTASQGVDLGPVEAMAEESVVPTFFRHGEPEDEDFPLEYPGPVSKKRLLVERIDESLKLATQPIGSSCDRILVLPPGAPILLDLGGAEREVIAEPLSLPPPNRAWTKANVRFVRLNKKTGRALFYLDGEPQSDRGAHFARIVDPSVHVPGNPYTQSFNDDVPLSVWVRQRRGEKGRLNLLWEISVQPPTQGTLFDG